MAEEVLSSLVRNENESARCFYKWIGSKYKGFACPARARCACHPCFDHRIDHRNAVKDLRCLNDGLWVVLRLQKMKRRAERSAKPSLNPFSGGR
eukprot:scaffold685_cov281-Pinguiococcus_pyrenoidosus.AAC.7